MDRLTHKTEGGYTVDEARLEQAVQRLGLFEDYYEEMAASHEAAAAKLEEMRAAGQKNTAKFKELLGKKLMDSNNLLVLKLKGIE